MKYFIFTIAVVLLTGCATHKTNSIDLVTSMPWKSRLERDIVYHTVDGMDLKLDIHLPDTWMAGPPWWGDHGLGKRPVFFYIHGGGFVVDDKESRQLRILPFIARDWIVVNINYRLSHEAKAPAAVADCLKALDWVFENAEKYQIDTDRIVVSGDSAGGHLALLTGMLMEGDSLCGGKYLVDKTNRVAAIINWFGSTDFSLQDPYQRSVYKTPHDWFDPNDDYEELIQSLSPVNYVRSGGVPVLTIHGTIDPAVPFNQAELLHKKLRNAGVMEKLVSIPDKKHGNFSVEERVMIFKETIAFLNRCNPAIKL